LSGRSAGKSSAFAAFAGKQESLHTIRASGSRLRRECAGSADGAGGMKPAARPARMLGCNHGRVATATRFLPGRKPMPKFAPALLVLTLLAAVPALAGEAEVKAAQSSIEAQISAFLAGDDERAYSYAAPNVKRIFPDVDRFMGMVRNGYQPVWKPRNFAFGKVEEISPSSIVQQVLLVGPDGKDYEAIYTLELQPDGTFRITGVSLRGSVAVGA
jgi:hypothetical protein